MLPYQYAQIHEDLTSIKWLLAVVILWLAVAVVVNLLKD